MKILLVEDELGIQQVVKKFIECKDAEVVLAETGQEAFKLASTEDFDVILLDFNMPGWNGVEAVKALDLIDKKPKIIIHSAYDMDKIKADLKGHDNVCRYIPKPFKLDELWDCIQEAISS